MSDASPIYENIPVQTGKAFTLRRDAIADFTGLFIETHFHLMYEIMWFRQTRGSFTIANEKYAINDNTLVFVPALLSHDMTLEAQPSHLRYLLQFEAQWLQDHAIALAPEQRIQPMVCQVSEKEAARIENLLGWSAESLTEQGTEELALAILKPFLLFTFHKLNHQISTHSTVVGQHVDQLVEFIHQVDTLQNYTLTTAEAATRCGWSISYFSRVFKNMFGQTLKEFLLMRKITLAVRLLSATDLKISDIALQTDFTDSAYFCAKFRNMMGCSPAVFRKKIRRTGCF